MTLPRFNYSIYRRYWDLPFDKVEQEITEEVDHAARHIEKYGKTFIYSHVSSRQEAASWIFRQSLNRAIKNGEACPQCKRDLKPESPIIMLADTWWSVYGHRACVFCWIKAIAFEIRDFEWHRENRPNEEPLFSNVFTMIENRSARLLGKKSYDHYDKVPLIQNCEGCGRQVIGRLRESAKYVSCCERCQWRAQKRIKHDQRICQGSGCDVWFTPKRSDSLYHSNACRQRAYRNRQTVTVSSLAKGMSEESRNEVR